MFKLAGFNIGQRLDLPVHSALTAEERELLKPSSQYVRKELKAYDRHDSIIVPGEKPIMMGETALIVPLRKYDVPRVLSGRPSQELPAWLELSLTEDLTFMNHASRFSTLLHLEEMQMQVDIRKYDLKNKDLERGRGTRLYRLRVVGVRNLFWLDVLSD